MNLQASWRDLVTENPMRIEIQRLRRRFFSFSSSNSLNSVVLALAIVCYVGVLMSVISARGAFPPIGLVFAELALFTIMAPAMLYGAIAGEREKRTWDLLLAAPVSHGQIVAGKFLAALWAIGIASALVGVPIAINGLLYDSTDWLNLLAAEVTTVTFTILVAAITLFLSARCSRGLLALGITLGILAVWLIVVPPVASLFTLADPTVSVYANYFNPFFVLADLLQASEPSFGGISDLPPYRGWVQSGIYTLASALLVFWAAKTLTFAENDVRIVPHHHA